MNSYLETAIAVILVIIVFSVITYVIQELIAANFKYRGKMLKKSICQILNGDKKQSDLTDKLYNHPQIKNLKENLDQLPSYVPAANFAVAIMDLVAAKCPNTQNDLFKDFKTGIGAFSASNGDFSILLKNWSDNSKDLNELKLNIEKWYDSYMQRVTGWYKNKSTMVTRIIAIGVTLFFNVNIVVITKAINTNSALKMKLVNAAEGLVDHEEQIKEKYLGTVDSGIGHITQRYNIQIINADTKAKDSLTQMREKEIDAYLKNYNAERLNSIKTLVANTHVSELPIGWNINTFKKLQHTGLQGWALILIGWFIGVTTISMGAPFWFELLIKLVNVRRAGIKPEAKGQA